MTEQRHDGCRGGRSGRGAVHDAAGADSAMVCEGDVCYVPASRSAARATGVGRAALRASQPRRGARYSGSVMSATVASNAAMRRVGVDEQAAAVLAGAHRHPASGDRSRRRTTGHAVVEPSGVMVPRS